MARLSESDWIKCGLRTLANRGFNALKVGPLSQSLNVSRGSFYWHFKDIADFRSQLLKSWREASTEAIIRDLDSKRLQVDGLNYLLQRALKSSGKLERAIRSWAATDKSVANLIASIDEKRVSRIAMLLVDAGVESGIAQYRAAFLYWAYLGRSMVIDTRRFSLPDFAVQDIAALFRITLRPSQLEPFRNVTPEVIHRHARKSKT